MTLRCLAVACLAVLCGCSSGDFQTAPAVEDASADGTATDTTVFDSSPEDAASADTTTTDSAAPDAAKPDTTPVDSASPDAVVVDAGKPDSGPDAPAGECTTASDCRLFSSYCKDEGELCVCFALGNAEPNPTCTSGKGTCFVDPCLGKAARCSAGTCVVE